MRAASGDSFGARRRACGRGQAGQLRVQGGGRGVERGLVDRLLGQLALERVAVEAALMDVPVGEDEHEEARAVGERHELGVAEPRSSRSRRRHDRCRMRAPGQDAGRKPQPVVAGERDLAELVADRQLVGHVELGIAHERLDVQAVAEVGGDPARARVRVRQQAERLELGHRAAHGRRRDAESVALDEGFRAHRDRREDVVLHDGAQHRPLPLGQLGARLSGGTLARGSLVLHRLLVSGAFGTLTPRVLTVVVAHGTPRVVGVSTTPGAPASALRERSAHGFLVGALALVGLAGLNAGCASSSWGSWATPCSTRATRGTPARRSALEGLPSLPPASSFPRSS